VAKHTNPPGADDAEGRNAEPEVQPPPRPVLDFDLADESSLTRTSADALSSEAFGPLFRAFQRHTPGAAQATLARVTFGLDAAFALYSEADDRVLSTGASAYCSASQRLISLLDDPEIDECARLELLRDQTTALREGDAAALCLYRDMLFTINTLGRVVREREANLGRLANALDNIEAVGADLVELYRRHQMIRGLLAPRRLRLHLQRLLIHIAEHGAVLAGVEQARHLFGF
jgi:hypothetical protein